VRLGAIQCSSSYRWPRPQARAVDRVRQPHDLALGSAGKGRHRPHIPRLPITFPNAFGAFPGRFEKSMERLFEVGRGGLEPPSLRIRRPSTVQPEIGNPLNRRRYEARPNYRGTRLRPRSQPTTAEPPGVGTRRFVAQCRPSEVDRDSVRLAAVPNDPAPSSAARGPDPDPGAGMSLRRRQASRRARPSLRRRRRLV
jgi:hypothetical protein